MDFWKLSSGRADTEMCVRVCECLTGVYWSSGLDSATAKLLLGLLTRPKHSIAVLNNLSIQHHVLPREPRFICWRRKDVAISTRYSSLCLVIVQSYTRAGLTLGFVLYLINEKLRITLENSHKLYGCLCWQTSLPIRNKMMMGRDHSNISEWFHDPSVACQESRP